LVGINNKAPLIHFGSSPEQSTTLLAVLNSVPCDYVTRQKIGGSSLNFFIARQVAVCTSEMLASWAGGLDWFRSRADELSIVSVDLSPSPFRFVPARRFELRCELDAALFHLYGIERDDVDYIMDTFPIVRSKDVAKYGSYRTKERILAIYDEMAECIAKGTEWKSPLDPPPGDPRAAWTEEEMEMWRAGRGDALVEKYGLLDDAHDLEDSDPDQDAEAECPADAEAEAVD
jgi:hypothetical protein